MTITEALNMAKPGTQILIKPGLYKEGIVIDKHVEISGDGDRSNIIIQVSGKEAVSFNSGKIFNLTVHHTGNEWYHLDCNCIEIAQGDPCIEDCDISSQSATCVFIHSSANPRLCRNRIHNEKYNGIIIDKKGQGVLEDNEIVGNGFSGVTIMKGSNPTLRRNRISQNGLEGIRVLGSNSGGIFEDNDLRGNAEGAWKIDPECESRVQRRGNIE